MDTPFFRPSNIQIPALKSYNGELRVPGSKSITNRVLLVSALAAGTTRLHNLLKSDDTSYMGEALKSLGVHVEMSEDFTEAVIEGSGAPIDAQTVLLEDGKNFAGLYLGNAGTAMRSLCAALALGRGVFHLSGEERMKERPIRDLVDALRSLGADISYLETEGFPPVCINAHGLKGGSVSVRGNISSQYLTALLICAPYAESPLHIHVEGELISAPYILLTLDVMKHFGIEVKHADLMDFYVPKGVYKTPGDYMVEGDASSASYPLAAAAIAGGKVCVLGVGTDCRQGDIAFVDVLKKMGAAVTMGPDWVECTGPQGKLKSLGEFNAVLLEDVGDFGGGAVLVVRENRDDDGDGALDGLVLRVDERGGLEFARALLDGAFDVVVRHLRGLGLCDERTEGGVRVRITALGLHDDRDFLAQLREDLALLRVRRAFRALDCRPVAVT